MPVPDAEQMFLLTFRTRASLNLPSIPELCALGMSDREAESVLGSLHGLTALEQAQSWGGSAETKRWHIKNIYTQFEVDRATLAHLVFGLLGARR